MDAWGLKPAVVSVLVFTGSVVSIGFGLWHFFVPRMWGWYSYMDASATELVLAVRATNVFFSLSLVLFGLVNVLVSQGSRADRYSALVVLGATSVLWAVRVLMQIVHPQGSTWPLVQHGILAAFLLVLVCYSTAFVVVVFYGKGVLR